MRRNAALLTMLACEVAVVAGALLFYLKVRPTILSAFADYGTALPGAAALALSRGLLPGTIGFSVLCALAGLALPLRRSRRSFLVGVGLLVVSIALIFAVWAGFQPIFQPA